MRYEDIRRLRGVDHVWWRVKLWLRPSVRPRLSAWADLAHLSDHERRDIGLPEPVRYADWRSLRANGWF